MEIVISVSEAELEEFPEEAPESSGQQEQSSETLHAQGTVKSLLSINTSPTLELEKIQQGRIACLLGNTPEGGSDCRFQTYKASKRPAINRYSKRPGSLAIYRSIKAYKQPRCLHKLLKANKLTNCRPTDSGSIYCCVGFFRWLHQFHLEVEE